MGTPAQKRDPGRAQTDMDELAAIMRACTLELGNGIPLRNKRGTTQRALLGTVITLTPGRWPYKFKSKTRLEAKDDKIRDLDNLNERLKTQVDMTLAAAWAYAIKPDEYPGQDILRMVEGLNEGILNTATSIHDLSAKVPRTDYYELILEGPNYEIATAATSEGLYKLTSQVDGNLSDRDPDTPPTGPCTSVYPCSVV